MKIVLRVMSIATSLFPAGAKSQFLDHAEKQAAAHLEMRLDEFRKENTLIFMCKHKIHPNFESIQFGNGSGLVGVGLEIINGECVTRDVYTGQDDQDFSETDFQEQCIP